MPTTPLDAIAGTTNACQLLPNVVTGGQPGPAQLEAFRAAGGEAVLDLREPTEARPFDEPALAASLGLEYTSIPVGPLTMTDETLERITSWLREHEGRSVLFHCASGNRVGATALPYLMQEQGMTEEDALQAAMRAGLRMADLLHWGLAYARGRAQG
ncbi:MAG: hypothetical protein NW201_12140 [Gemmatimonadales bacterium]|nr:hypothetical protein [Gemmatimonadales bacterium]